MGMSTGAPLTVIREARKARLEEYQDDEDAII